MRWTMATILVADDCANIREFCRQELEEEGYRVLLARDGKEAVDIVQAERPDLAILDIWMPRANGFDAAERIAAVVPGIPVIFFTNNDELCLRDPRSAFAAACVEKGDDFTELKRTIVSVLARPNGASAFRRGLPPIEGHGPAVPHSPLPGTVLPVARNR